MSDQTVGRYRRGWLTLLYNISQLFAPCVALLKVCRIDRVISALRSRSINRMYDMYVMLTV